MESECLTVVMEEKRQNRIGIITMYYNSSNYGGLLQAYALCKYLNDSGYPTKQITYDFYRKTISSSKDYKNLVSFLFKRLQKRTNNLIIKTINIIHGVSELRKDRRNICAEFRASIPHTETVYNDNSIEDCNNLFDIFIAGSDQVWNPDVFRPSFFLSFVNEEKKKISYAASIGNSITGKEMQSEYEDALNKFDRISVREKSDINKLEDLCKKRVEWVVDPVFLLTEKQWETVSSPVQLNINKEYIFCYFLGGFAAYARNPLSADIPFVNTFREPKLSEAPANPAIRPPQSTAEVRRRYTFTPTVASAMGFSPAARTRRP